MKYPIGIQTFSKLREDGYVYVDKTMYIRELVDSGMYYFLSRPRRFGKSLLLSTIEAYFRGQKELFEGLAIAQTETEWAEHPIVRIDFAGMMTSSVEVLQQNLECALEDVAKEYGIEIPQERRMPNLAFSYLISSLCEKYGRKVVVLIDEYDKGIIETLRDEQENAKALDVLRPFFSVLKSQDKYIRFAFITGVSRFRNTTIFSGFNNPTDISLAPKYASICGITETELQSYLKDGIKNIAEIQGLSEDKTFELLRAKYDGYRFTVKNELVFNPFSVLNVMEIGLLDNYWVMSGTSKILVDYLRASHFSLDELTSRWVTGEQLGGTYSAADPLSLFFQTGYLTIGECRSNAYRLRIPNQEVQNALVNLLIPEFVEGNARKEVETLSLDLICAIEGGDVDTMMRILRSLASSVPYHEIEPKLLERHIHLCMYIVFMMLGVSTRCEQAASAGRVDMVAETPWRVYVMEFKIDGTPRQAMEQIDSKGYAIPWEAQGRIVTKVGVNFSSSLRTIESWEYETLAQ